CLARLQHADDALPSARNQTGYARASPIAPDTPAAKTSSAGRAAGWGECWYRQRALGYGLVYLTPVLWTWLLQLAGYGDGFGHSLLCRFCRLPRFTSADSVVRPAAALEEIRVVQVAAVENHRGCKQCRHLIKLRSAEWLPFRANQ